MPLKAIFLSSSSETFLPVSGQACTLLLLQISRLTRFFDLKFVLFGFPEHIVTQLMGLGPFS